MWIFVVLACATSAAGRDIWFSSHKVKHLSAPLRAWGLTTGAIPIGFGILLVTGVSEVAPHFWSWFILDCFLMVAAIILLMRALSQGPLAQTQPILAITPVVIMFTNPWITGEMVSWIGWVGVGMIALGIYGAQMKKIDTDKSAWQNFIAPLKVMMTQPGIRAKLGTALIYAITSSIDSICTKASSPAFYIFIESIVVSIMLAAIVMVQRSRVAEKEEIKAKNIRNIMIGGLIKGNTNMLQFWALTLAPVPLVIAVKRSSILLTNGWSFFKRKDHEYNWYRISGVCLSVAGVIVLIFT